MPTDLAHMPSVQCALGRRQAYAACLSQGTVLGLDCRQSRLPLTLRTAEKQGQRTMQLCRLFQCGGDSGDIRTKTRAGQGSHNFCFAL